VDIKLPIILSPNLGCPFIIAPQDLMNKGIEIVTAEAVDGPAKGLTLQAIPSFGAGDAPFSLELKNQRELSDPSLPAEFQSLEETRFLISTTLANEIFSGKARFFRYHAVPAGSSKAEKDLRISGGKPRVTLYDLVLQQDGSGISKAFHALCLRPKSYGPMRFMHLTDLHIALRNDVYDTVFREGLTDRMKTSRDALGCFINFNENLRTAIECANNLADDGELDFVIMTGDLVDFAHHGFTEREYSGENSWRVFRSIILGADSEQRRPKPNLGLKLPLFTSTGNHDWRHYPYQPRVDSEPYNLNKETAKELDPFWADQQAEITRRKDMAYNNMLREGSLLSNLILRSEKIQRWTEKMRKSWVDKPDEYKASQKFTKSFVDESGEVGPSWAKFFLAILDKRFVQFFPAALGGSAGIAAKSYLLVGLFGLLSLFLSAIPPFFRWIVKRYALDIVGLEAGWKALQDYFLTVNPYFNYAFRVEDNYFLLMDTGHDCLCAERFWDGGEKKLGSLSIQDNILGGSPDSMAFYDANEYYPYSQITWIDRLLKLVKKMEPINKDKKINIFICLHAPPVNLSKGQREKADSAKKDLDKDLLLDKAEYDIRFGTINHYLSQFFHLCLGTTELVSEDIPTNPIINMVLAGHAHWKLECCLRWEKNEKENKYEPVVYYNDFTAKSEAMPNCSWPLLLQTPAVGPRGPRSIEGNCNSPPYCRIVEINDKGEIMNAEVARPEKGKNGNVLRKFWKPDGQTIDPDNQKWISDWMQKNGINSSIPYFIYVEKNPDKRVKAIEDLRRDDKLKI